MNYLESATGATEARVERGARVSYSGRARVAGVVRTMRPRQWVKNLFVVLPVVFTKGLLDAPRLVSAFVMFCAFCAASSAVYFLNDLADVERDRAHPQKRHRPIASGLLSDEVARRAGALLAMLALALAASIDGRAALLVVAYLALNVAYTFKLKHVAYLDVLCIATGFELRLVAGIVAVQAEPSKYLIVVAFALASFLGFGKRMHELLQGSDATRQRAVLQRYAVTPLRWLMVVNGLVTIVAYLLATIDPHNVVFFGSSRLAYTTVFTALGVARFGHLVSHRPEAESPTEEMLQDPPFIANLVAWFATVVLVLYAGR